MPDKTYLCIDLKSFYASVECVERGLDPFKTNLVVADPARGRGGICLAMVDHITVHSKKDIRVTFTDGAEIKAYP